MEENRLIKSVRLNSGDLMWDDSEISLVKEYYGIIKRDELLKKLPNRTWESIKHRAREMHISYRNRPRKLFLSPTECAYIAGIVDGEGCINFNAFDNAPVPQLQIANTDERLITYLREKLATLNVYYWKKPQTETQKIVYHMCVANCASIQALLEQIVPYMVIKKERAELMMQFTSSRVGVSVKDPYTVNPRPIISKIKQLNKRGPKNNVLTEEGERT